MVTVAMVREAGRCADLSGSSSWGGTAIAHPFVDDVLGWWRDGNVYQQISVTKAGCD